VFYADRDVSKFGTTVCVRLDRLELSARAVYYVVRSLALLRSKTIPKEGLRLDEIEKNPANSDFFSSHPAQ